MTCESGNTEKLTGRGGSSGGCGILAAAVAGAGGGSGTARAQLALRQCAVFLDLTFVNAPEVAIRRFEQKCFDEATGDLASESWSEKVKDLVERLLRLEALLHPEAEPERAAKVQKVP